MKEAAKGISSPSGLRLVVHHLSQLDMASL